MKLIFRPPTEFRGQVEDVELDVNPDILVENIRLKVEKKLGCDTLKLSCHGKTMQDDQPLRIYDPKEKDTITIQPKHFGSYLPKGVQPEKRKMDAEEPEVAQVVEGAKKPRLIADASLLVDEAIIQRDGFQIIAGTHGEQGRRRQMEDRHLICTSLRAVNSSVPAERDFAVFGVFDGHGGNKTADFVRSALPAELATQVVKFAEEPVSDKNIRKIFNEAFARVDSRIASELAGVVDGCCAVVLISLGAQCWIANLGDSAGILARSSDGDSFKAIPLSSQHTCYVMKEKERIMRMGGAVDNGRINGILEVSRAFGDMHLKKFGVIASPEFMKVTIDPSQDKYIVLGCDGLFTSQPPAETVDIVNEHLGTEQERAAGEENDVNVSDVCKEICRYMLSEQKVQDNLTCMLLVVNKTE